MQEGSPKKPTIQHYHILPGKLIRLLSWSSCYKVGKKVHVNNSCHGCKNVVTLPGVHALNVVRASEFTALPSTGLGLHIALSGNEYIPRDS